MIDVQSCCRIRMTEATHDSADRNAGVEHTGGGEMPKAVQRELPNPGSAPQSNKGERHSVGAPGSGTVGFGAENNAESDKQESTAADRVTQRSW